ncbi:Sorting nexin-4 [Frankliniella fusca]|uniref:Sorting nexin-4 n=1 Tax=Frankliniella fusca TaxID=407009 RepID=A0AAE1GUT1_9NEOP|nr:Sorting nexin-4 [Frankliniella fusca]
MAGVTTPPSDVKGELRAVEENSESTEKKDALIKHMDINVPEAEKRINGALNLHDFYTVYLIETKVTDPVWLKNQQGGTIVRLGSLWRRYTEFEILHNYLSSMYPYIVLPPLPEKRVLYSWQKVATDTFDPDFVDRRRAGLENFLLRIASHPILSFNQQFLAFLQQEHGWQPSAKEHGYFQQLAESTQKSMIGLRELDKRFEQVKNYSNELQGNMTNILRVRAVLAERLYGIHKLHANYGRIFSEWSAVEKDMGDGLQKAGHYLDSVAASIDTALEEEELLADQLKEYLFSAGALHTVCCRHEMLQFQVERAQDLVQQNVAKLERVQQGKTSFMSRIFGTVDTDELREERVSVLEQRIEEHKGSVTNTMEQRDTFSKAALLDIQRFQEQKVIDMRETFANYIMLQMKIARKGLQTWTHIRDCLESIN